MATINTTELAIELDTTPRELRKFLRSDARDRDASTPGKGARYAIERRELRALRTRFNAWQDSRNAADPATD